MALAKQSPFQACGWDPCRDLVEWQTTPQHVSNFENVKKLSVLYGLKRCPSVTLLGWAWIDSAFATDRALKRKGKPVPKHFFSASPSESTLLSR